MFENINWMVSNIFAAADNDFVIRENESPEDIETSSGVAATDEKTRTCALCVALNNTVFRNDNKPILSPPLQVQNHEVHTEQGGF